MENKMEGSYYTPYATVEFMYRYFFEQKQEVKSLLEPSAGDGRFIDIFCKKADIDKIVGVEINENKAEQLKSKNYPKNVEIITSDFLAASSTFHRMPRRWSSSVLLPPATWMLRSTPENCGFSRTASRGNLSRKSNIAPSAGRRPPNGASRCST